MQPSSILRAVVTADAPGSQRDPLQVIYRALQGPSGHNVFGTGRAGFDTTGAYATVTCYDITAHQFADFLRTVRDENDQPLTWSLAWVEDPAAGWQVINSTDTPVGEEWALAFQVTPGVWIVYDETFGVWPTQEAAERKRHEQGHAYSDGGASAMHLVRRVAGPWTTTQPDTNLAEETESQIAARRRHV